MSLIKRLATPLQVLTTLLLYVQLSLIYGVAATPPVMFVQRLWVWRGAWPEWLQLPGFLVGCFAACFLFLFCLCIVVAVFRLVTFAGTPVGRFPYHSFKAFQWASFNALILAVRFTVMNFMRVTPFQVFFYRMMGMRVGARVQINTAIVGVANLIEVGDDSMIGGDVTLICHSAEAGKLVTAPVKIGKRVSVGLNAVILPGCQIGDGATVAAGALLPKGTFVPPGTLWAGIPARQIRGAQGAAGGE